MAKVLDYGRIQNQEYSVSQSQIKSFKEYKSDFPTLFNKITDIAFDVYGDHFPHLWNTNLRAQMREELLLVCLEFLSSCTSSYVAGLDNFFFSDEYSVNAKPPVDLGRRTLDRKVQKLTQCENKTLEIKKLGPGFSYNEYRSVSVNTYVEDSPLLDYLKSHLLSPSLETDNALFSELLEENHFHGNTSYLFCSEGRYFMGTLFKIIDSSLYTKKSDYISLKSICTVLEDLCSSFSNTQKLSTNLESYLFLANAENIYHLSWVKNVFSNFPLFLCYWQEKSVSLSAELCAFINRMNDCPLNTLRIFMWNAHFKNLFTPKLPDYKREQQYADLKYFDYLSYIPVQTAQEMTDFIFYSLLYIYDCFPDEDLKILEGKDEYHLINKAEYELLRNKESMIYENMRILKTHIITLLDNNRDNSHIPWSILEFPKKEQVIPTTGSDYWDSLLSNTFSLTTKRIFNQNFLHTELSRLHYRYTIF